MLSRASLEIGQEHRAALIRRYRAARLVRPYVYCDRLIQQLEEMHLKGKKFVPKAFLPELYRLLDLLPPEMPRPEGFRSLIRDVLDQVFDLQEKVLRLRDPLRETYVELEEPEAIIRAS